MAQHSEQRQYKVITIVTRPVGIAFNFPMHHLKNKVPFLLISLPAMS
jgi:hypothetical protein